MVTTGFQNQYRNVGEKTITRKSRGQAPGSQDSVPGNILTIPGENDYILIYPGDIPHKKNRLWFILLLFLTVALAAVPASGCSEFLLKTEKPGEVVSGRTMDFYYMDSMKATLMVELRNQNWTSVSSVNPEKPGFSWTNKYGFVGFRTKLAESTGFSDSDTSRYLDTLNEDGLSASFLHNVGSDFPGTVTIPEKALLYLDVPAYIAGNFRTVEES
jgi:penicillin V acylase-like amidase (Ntn superfamily)